MVQWGDGLTRKSLAAAFPYTLPVLMGYLSIGIVFGWMMAAIGYNAIWSFFMSLTVYAGSGQYLGVELLGSLAPLTDVAFLTLVINFRHLVYGLSMLEKFKGMGARKLYMIASLTDETYALLAGVSAPEGVDEKQFYFSIAVLDHLYWIAGSVIGGIAGSLITINTEGIDFAMTALFVVICVDQWKAAKTHIPAVTGFICGALFLVLIRSSNFILPALAAAVAMLLFLRRTVEQKMEED